MSAPTAIRPDRAVKLADGLEVRIGDIDIDRVHAIHMSKSAASTQARGISEQVTSLRKELDQIRYDETQADEHFQSIAQQQSLKTRKRMLQTRIENLDAERRPLTVRTHTNNEIIENLLPRLRSLRVDPEILRGLSA